MRCAPQVQHVVTHNVTPNTPIVLWYRPSLMSRPPSTLSIETPLASPATRGVGKGSGSGKQHQDGATVEIDSRRTLDRQWLRNSLILLHEWSTMLTDERPTTCWEKMERELHGGRLIRTLTHGTAQGEGWMSGRGQAAAGERARWRLRARGGGVDKLGVSRGPLPRNAYTSTRCRFPPALSSHASCRAPLSSRYLTRAIVTLVLGSAFEVFHSCRSRPSTPALRRHVAGLP